MIINYTLLKFKKMYLSNERIEHTFPFGLDT
jgi:hypothetical protein